MIVRRLIAAIAIALFAASAAGAALAADDPRVIRLSGRAGAPSVERITLPLDKAAIVELDTDARDVLVSNPKIVDAVVRTPRRIFVFALAAGQTNAFFFDGQGRQIASLEISVERDVTDLNRAIMRHMPNESARAESLNDNIVLDGTVASAEEASKAQDLAARFATAPEKVTNHLDVRQREQVLIKVRVAEMQRTVAKQLGVDLAAVGRLGNTPFTAATSNPLSLLGRALSDLSGVQVGNTLTGGSDVQGVLKALERVGLVRTLAEPNLTAVSGESARFLAGGEFPVPVSRDQNGNVVVEFKQFGVGLAFTPVVLSQGRISLQVSTEVSELTNQGAFTNAGNSFLDQDGNVVTVQGLTIPALSVRRAETTVELSSGGSLVIGGLLQHTTKQNVDAFPGLKDVPVLGALFRSRDFQNSETELVVMVTAYLVDQMHEEEIALPTDKFVVPADAETILLGRLNAVYGRERTEAAAAPGVIGYIVQ